MSDQRLATTAVTGPEWRARDVRNVAREAEAVGFDAIINTENFLKDDLDAQRDIGRQNLAVYTGFPSSPAPRWAERPHQPEPQTHQPSLLAILASRPSASLLSC
jgi:hypothetical protein